MIRHERATLDRTAKIFEHGQDLFAEGADVGTDTDMPSSAFQGAKAAGDLDARFHEAEIALGFIVGKGQFPSPQESQDQIVVSFETIQKVLLFGLLAMLARFLLRAERVCQPSCA